MVAKQHDLTKKKKKKGKNERLKSIEESWQKEKDKTGELVSNLLHSSLCYSLPDPVCQLSVYLS